MKRLITALAIILVFSCNEKKKDSLPALNTPDSTYTTGIVAINVSSNDYRAITLLRVVKDTSKLTTTDSTGGKITQEKKVVRDTAYLAWWPYLVSDSTKKILKSLIDPSRDSVIFKFIPVHKDMVLQDFNKQWKPQ